MTHGFSSLSPQDFENLARDLVGLELGVRLEAFAEGQDGGMDGRHASDGGSIILQAKHYERTRFSGLKAAMTKERAAIDRLKPARYVLATSARLTPQNKEELAVVIGPALRSLSDIFGGDDLMGLLRKYPDIERAHHRLWAPTSTVLGAVVAQAVEQGLRQPASEQARRDSELSAKLDGMRDGLDRMAAVLVPDLEVVTGYLPLTDVQIERLPTAMVIADFGIVPFDDPRGLCRDLLTWAESASSPEPSGQLYIGRGGTGKTRLALEAITRLRERGWSAGLVTREALDRIDIHGRNDAQARLARFFANRGPCGSLLVLDYAESRQSQIDLVVKAAQNAPPGSPIKIVLLARTAGEWWLDYLHRSRDAQMIFDTVPVLGIEQDIAPADRRTLFDAAALAFGLRLESAGAAGNLLDKGWQSTPAPDERLKSPAASTVLAIIFEAFLHVRGVGLSLDPVVEMVREEQLHWARALRLDPSDQSGDAQARMRLVRHAVATLTLMQGAKAETAAALEAALDQLVTISSAVVQLPGSSDAARARSFRDSCVAIERLYRHATSDREGLRPVLPDILGEAVVGQVLSENPSLLAALLSASPASAHDAFIVLNRMSGLPWDAASPNGSAAAAALRDGLVGRLGSVSDPLMSAANDVVGRLQDTVRDVLAHYPAALKRPAATALINSAAAVISHLGAPPARLRLLLGDAALLAGTVAEAQQPQDVQGLLALVGRTIKTETNRSAFLEAVGAFEEATRSAGAALSLARKLFHVDEGLWAPLIVNAELNYASALRMAGHREEAYTHAVRASQLCEQYGDDSEPWVAQRRRGLAEFASCSAAVGKYGDAYGASIEILQAYRPFPEDIEACNQELLSALAAVFGSHAIRSAEVHRNVEAAMAIRHALTYRRELAKRDPDTFLPDLAGTLANLSGMLGSIDNGAQEAFDAGSEAISIWELLIPSSPAFRDGLVSAYSITARACLDLGLSEDALGLELLGLTLVRALHAEHPPKYAAQLAQLCFDHGHTLITLGAHEEALSFLTESVARFRSLVSENCEIFAPKLAKGLNNLAGSLLKLDRASEGIAPAREAAELRGAMLPDGAKFGVDYGRSLSMLGDILKAASHATEALDAYEQAAFALRPILGLDASVQRLFEVNLNDLCRMLRALAREGEIDAYCARLSVPSPAPTARDDLDFLFDSFEAAGERFLNEAEENEEDEVDRDIGEGRDEDRAEAAVASGDQDDGRFLRIISGRLDERTALWCIVAVKPSMYRAYETSLRLGMVNPTDFDEFGEVLDQGEGVEPSDGVIAQIAGQFGVTPEHLLQILQST